MTMGNRAMYIWRRSVGAVLVLLALAILSAGGAVAMGGPSPGVHGATLSRVAAHVTAGGTLPAGLAPALRRALTDATSQHSLGRGPAATMPMSGTTWTQQAELTAPNPTIGRFGYSVSISGGTALVGAPGSGAAFVFVRSGTTWSQQAEITPTGITGGYFGGAVALSGDTAAIGARSADGDKGAVFVFVRSGTTWSQQAEITPTNSVAFDEFGTSVGISGQTIVIGTAASRAAYVYVRSGTSWIDEARLSATGGGTIHGSVAISGNTVLLEGSTGSSGVGAVYVFVRSGTTWTQQAELVDPNGMASDYFGLSLALSGNTAAIGATGQVTGALNGAVYVFVRSGTTWTQQAMLLAPSSATVGSFGNPVALSGNTLLIGFQSSDRPGMVYVFVRGGTTWGEQAQLTGTCASASSNFSWSMGVSGNTAIIGAYGPGTCGETGAAYVFVRS